MNIIEKTREIINTFPEISDFSNGISIDYEKNETGSFGLFSAGETVLKTFITGDKLIQHSFHLYGMAESATDYDRLNNSDFLLKLSHYLSDIRNIVFSDGIIEKIECSNAMIFEIPAGIENGGTYSIQINVQYKTN